MPTPVKTITTSITIGLDKSTSEGSLSAEIDNRPAPCGLNNGKTNFMPGDRVAILVYEPLNTVAHRAYASDGNAYFSGSDSRSFTDKLKFSNSDKATLSKPANGAVSVLRVNANATTGALTGPLADGITMKTAKVGRGNYKVKFSAAFQILYLQIPGGFDGDEIDVDIEADIPTDEGECD